MLPYFSMVWQGTVGTGQVQGKSCIAAHAAEQRGAQGIAGCRFAGNALAVSQVKAL